MEEHEENYTNEGTDECNQNTQAIDNCAVLDMIQYMDCQDPSYNGMTVAEYVDAVEKALENDPDYISDPAKLEAFYTVREAINNGSEVGDYTILSQSSTVGIPLEYGTYAAYGSPDGDVYVAYRGTGDGKWVDNGEGMTLDGTVMQRASVEFYDSVIENSLPPNYNGNMILTGHSKGGNEAQYVALFSEYGYQVDRVYNIDGQGMSQAAIDQAIELYGEDYYYGQLDKMYSICGYNDYVHGLGNVIISDDHTVFLYSDSAGLPMLDENGNQIYDSEGNPMYIYSPASNFFMEYHALQFIMNDDCTGLAWEEEDGNIVSVPQGEFGKVITELDLSLMGLDLENLNDCSISMMSVLELMMNDASDFHLWGTGNRHFANPEEAVGFMVHGVPKILATIFFTEEGREWAWDTVEPYVDMGVDAYIDGYFGVCGILGVEKGTVVYAFCTIIALLLAFELILVIGVRLLVLYLKALLWDILFTLAQRLAELAVEAYEFLKELISTLISSINAFLESIDLGCQYAQSNPYIKVDTDSMYSCATRLRNLNSLITSIDSDMDSLYWELVASSAEEAASGNVGTAVADLSGFWNLIVADVMTTYSLRLWACASYLENTAERFENVENELASI